VSDFQIFDGYSTRSREIRHQITTAFADIPVSAGIMRSHLVSAIDEGEQYSHDPFWWRIWLSTEFLNSAATNASRGA
jgi:hypothetical protein